MRHRDRMHTYAKPHSVSTSGNRYLTNISLSCTTPVQHQYTSPQLIWLLSCMLGITTFGLDGFGLVGWLQKSWRISRIPQVLSTSRSGQTDRQTDTTDRTIEICNMSCHPRPSQIFGRRKDCWMRTAEEVCVRKLGNEHVFKGKPRGDWSAQRVQMKKEEKKCAPSQILFEHPVRGCVVVATLVRYSNWGCHGHNVES